MLQQIRDRWQSKRFEKAFHEAELDHSRKWRSGTPPPEEAKLIRSLTDDELHGWLSRAQPGLAQIAMQRELRRREAWSAPAGRAFWISIISMVISAAALITSFLK